MVLYSQIPAKFPEFVAIKLSSIVRDDHPGDSKPVDDVFPNGILYLGLCYYYQRFFLDPIHEIVNNNKQKFDLLLTLWQWTNNVDSPC